MSRRVLATVLASSLLLVAACGSSDSTDSKKPAGQVSVTGDFGSAPSFKFDKGYKTSALATKVLITGTGAKVEKTDTVEMNFAIGNPSSENGVAFDGFGGAGLQLAHSEDLLPGFREVFSGQTYGSRLLVTGPADKVFQEGGIPDYGVGNKDSVALVIDIEKKFKVRITDKFPQYLPKVVEKDGKVTGLDFAGIKKPKEKWPIVRHVVKEGSGETVTQDMTVTVNYFGSVYGAKKPFDESYSKEPVSFPLTQVVAGWTYGLDGLKVGSRVLLGIPPSYGYGDEEKPNIPANSTLYFVVDIQEASTEAPPAQ